jgi:hypothetical protein
LPKNLITLANSTPRSVIKKEAKFGASRHWAYIADG